ncbi:hypothetical protein ACQR5U_07905 [Xanthomonas oryzae pv. oryzicola]|uniref:hypothetical protein n=1 Tax=Xanthomonas oryzae TaxID=347 RepID=UPI000B40DD45|nr:hypothetical protein [Xanthomonas oryzae]OWB23597.1 hypothetical protein XocBAI20_19190 [Xanthomonas oryzae pv. oryzicola]
MARPATKQKSQPSIARSEGKSQPLSRERIAADIAVFHKTGGRIEVLTTNFGPARDDGDKIA